MQYSITLLALVAAVSAVPQAVTSAIAPMSSPPAGCSTSYSGAFEIETVNASMSAKRDLAARQATALTVTLSNGMLTDDKGRTGYIANNSQFQFDSPPQAGAIYTSGWSVCSNGSLAIGGTTLFKQCLSGDFYNLYLHNTAPQCSPIYIDVIPVGGSGAASQLSDGQPQATPVPICQISDGQPQVTACKPVTQISDGQIQATSAAHVVTQISDGQIQATTAKAPVTQISDGQIQAPKTTVGPVVTQISDGQIQATTARASFPVTYTGSTTRAVTAYTGAAVPLNMRGEVLGLAAGVLAAALI